MCSKPNVIIEQSFTQTNPKIVLRSNQITLSTVTYFACNLSQTRTNAWSLNKVVQQQQQQQQLVNVSLTSNPSSFTPMLVIKENTLDYGLYMITYEVGLNTTINEYMKSNTTTFIKVIPTGLAVYALENGIASIRIGYKQSLKLQPSLYSIDFDYVISPNSLSFTFFCRVIDLNQNKQNFLIEDKSDLKTKLISNNSSWNETCFKSKSDLSFESSGNTLLIRPDSLVYKSNIKYEFG